MLDTAIIGAGPYGLSLAAHLRRTGISFRIFGRPMDTWREHMPEGMMLKSYGFASNLYDPEGICTLQNFCAERGIAYHHTDIPVRLDTFANYGVAFRERMVPNLEENDVLSIARCAEGFLLRLSSGEELYARRVALAVGITHFKYIPEVFAPLGSEFVSHTYEHRDLKPYRGRNVVVIGGGASAIELSGLLHEAGVDARLVARRKKLHFHNPPGIGKDRPLWERMRNPQSGLGTGWKSRFFANWPSVFRYLPERLRLALVRRTLGPSAGWTSKKQVVGHVPLHLGMTTEAAEVVAGKVRLTLRDANGSQSEIFADHIISGTGYKVDIEKLQFLSADIRRDVTVVQSAPVLSSDFESSVPGLYFLGLAAANTFGPVLRFAFGAGFAARRVTKALERSAWQKTAPVATVEAVPAAHTEGTITR
jgi:cation diffusion facilitator CzcD-associated flavoprotein CzcO